MPVKKQILVHKQKLKRLVEKSKPHIKALIIYIKKIYPLLIVEFTRSFLATLLGKTVDFVGKTFVSISEEIRPITKVTKTDFKRILKFDKKKFVFQIKRWAIISRLFIKFLAQAVFEYCTIQIKELRTNPKQKLVGIYVWILQKIGAVLDFCENCVLQITRYFTYKKVVWLVITTLIIEFSSPILPAFLPLFSTIYANGNITTSSSSDFMFESTNPNFKAKFGNKKNQTEQKMVFEAKGKQMEVKMLDIAEASESSQSINKDEILNALDKPQLTIKEAAPLENDVLKENSALVDAVEQRVSSNVSIAHEIIPGKGVKESIIIDEPVGEQKVNGKFAFIITVDKGVVTKRSPALNDVWYFVDKYGRYLYHFEEPYAIDASKQMNKNVSLTLTALTPVDNAIVDTVIQKQTFFEKLATELGATIDNVKNKIPFVGDSSKTQYLAVVTADIEWMNDAGRVFPVTIDPTVVQDTNPNFASGVENRSMINTSNAVESQYKELQTDINTVGLWHFNEGSGTTAYDASGNNNTGTLTNGPVWNGPTDTPTGLGKSSLKFDGVNDYITYGGTVTPRSAISFSFWLNTSSTAEEMIFDNTNGNRNNEGYFAEINWPTANKLRFVGAKVSAENFAFVSNTSVNDGKWHHIALTWDGTTSTGGAKIYIDGVLDNTATSASATTNAPSYNFRIGATASGATIPFVGSLDEFKIDNVSRTPEEIAADANRFPYSIHESPVIDFGSTPNTLDSLNYSGTGIRTGDGEKPYSRDGLVAQWNFNETSGTTAYNMAGNDSCGGTPSSCNLTLNNFASTSSQDQAAGTGWTANDKRWGAGSINISSVATADTLSLSNPSTLDPNSADLSIETWVKTTDVTAELFSNNSANGVSCTSDGYYLGIDASGYPVFTLDTDGVTAGCDATITTSITKKVNDGIWHHLAATVTRGSAAYLYMDGVIIGSDTSITAYVSEAPSGNVLSGSTNAFDGTLDALRFYARALSSGEILANSQIGNIEFQTRTSADNATWEAWKPVTGETALDAVDNLSPVEKISQTNLTAYWKLDETSGSRADSKGANTLTDNNTVTYAPGRLGNAAQFTRANSEYLSIADNADLSTGDIDFTIGAWVYLDSKPAGDMTIISRDETGTTANEEYDLKRENASDKFNFFVSNSAGTHTTVYADTPTPIATGVWYFVLAWRDKTANSVNIQVNNGTVYTTGNGVIPIDGTATTRIGGRRSPIINLWDGKIDEVAFWKRTLTAAERTQLFEDGLDLHGAGSGRIYRTRDTTTKMEGTASEKLSIGSPQVDSSTVGAWHLEETSGTLAYIKDSSPNANHGTPTGTTVVDGFYGKGRSFNGTSSDYVTVGSSALIGNQTSNTVEAWVYVNSYSGHNTVYSEGNTGGSHYLVLTAALATSGYVNFIMTDQVVSCNSTSTNSVPLKKWTHIAGVRSGSNCYTYINGVLDGSASGNPGTLTINNALIGATKLNSSIAASIINGSVDEVKISNIARTAEEIAEAYRAGRDHRISKSVSSVDLSAKSKVPFYVASDRPGTFLEATIGESAYANYEPDANTVGLFHLEEQTGGGAYIKDSSSNGNNGTPTGSTMTQGKVGKARYFNGSSDYISIPDSSTWNFSTGDFTVDIWMKSTTVNTTYSDPYNLVGTSGNDIRLTINNTLGGPYYGALLGVNGVWITYGANGAFTDTQWHYFSASRTSGATKLYVDGILVGSNTSSAAVNLTGGTTRYIGTNTPSSAAFGGTLDEMRISNTARTPDEIRQAYEVGKRTHPITIDFKADLDSSNLIANTSDLSFAIQPDTDVAFNSLNINKGEKIIVKENVSGTEYLAQGTISAITYEDGTSNPNAQTQNLNNGSVTTVTVTSWDSGSTVPTGGFTTSASVFKWQREYMDLTQMSFASHRDAVTRLSLRVIDGSQGANVWIDDFESADYSDGSRVAIGSTAQRYFQYRAILNSPNSQNSPTLTNVTVNYNSGTTAQAPKVKDASSDFSATGTSLNRVTDTGSSNSPSLELAYKELPKDINTVGLWHMNENAVNTCSGGINDICDASGNTYNGAFAGNTTHTTTAKLGASAVTFDGTDDSITFANQVIPLGAKTVEAWVKRSGSLPDTNHILSNSDNDSTKHGTALFINSSGTAGWSSMKATVGTPRFNISSTKTINDGNWHHLAGTWDGTTNSNEVKLYIDGVLEVQGTAAATETTNATNNLYMGLSSTSGADLNGQIDEVRISNIARTPEEIKYDAGRRPYGVYTSDVQNLGSKVSSIDNIRWTENSVQTGDGETPYSTNGLVAQWNFNETSGTTAANASTTSCGNTCNATLNNFASTSSQDQTAGTGWTKDNKKWGNGAIMLASAATADTITVSDPASNQLDPNSSDLTIGVWVKTNDVTAELLSNNANNGTACTNNGYYLGIDASGYPNFYLDTDGVTAGCDTQISSLTTGKINDGNWHYLSVLVTRGTSALMYLDGVQIGSDTSVTSYASITVTGNIQIASNANYDGVIDVINFYSRALGATEILSNAQPGNVELQTRTGTTSTPNDGTWEEWRPSGNSTEVQLDNLQTLSPVQKINTSNLVGYWKLDEVSGNRADSAGSNTLTDNATVTSKAGHLNLAGQFTRANSEFLSITDNAALSTGDIDFTVAGWVYHDSLPSAELPIISKNSLAANDEFLLEYIGGGTSKYAFYVKNDNVQASSFGAASTGNWNFVVAWRDKISGTINIQINNGAVNSTSYTAAPTDTANALNIGTYGGGAAGIYFDGRIDETAMWKRVLTADERRILYEDGLDKTNDSVVGGINRTSDTTTKFEGSGSEKLTIGAPQVDSSTVALWHLDETSGTGAYIKDSTANVNNGTPTGTTSVDGFYGKGRSFNGSSDKVSVGTDITNFEFGSGAFTVEAWFKSTTGAGQWSNPIISYGTDTGAGSSWKIYAGQPIYGYIWQGGISYDVTATSTTNDGKWHHVALERDGNTLKIFVDGKQEDTQDVTGITNNDAATANLTIGNDSSTNYFNGSIDEIRVTKGSARSAEEIAEAYRAGRDHRLTKTITSTDLSAKTKLPFYVASDRPGTFLEATVGESAYANYEPDANTVGLWHLDEQTGTANTYIKDSSGRGNNTSTITGTTYVQGKVGKARDFNGTSDVLIITDASNLNPTTAITISSWIKTDAVSGTNQIVEKMGASVTGYMTRLSTGAPDCLINGGNSTTSPTTISTGVWTHVVCTYDSANIKLYVNGQLAKSTAYTTAIATHIGNLQIGKRIDTTHYFDGSIDEVRIDNVARTADEIRQAYEVGKRTHQITNDFVTTPQAAYSSGTSVTINNPYGTTNLTDTLSIGDTMIFKENVGGTETVSQAVVTNIVNTSSVYGTVTLLAALTFPSGGYTTNATVFKWQREFMNITNSLTSQRDAATRITLRVTDGSQGANVWIDDIKAAGPYLTASNTRTASVTSTVRQYLQYRIIFSTTDPLVSPTVTSVSVQTHSNPVKVIGSDTLGADGSFDKDGNLHLGSNNVKKVSFYDRTKDQISYALDFDGSNDYTRITDNTTFDLTNFTLSTWVKTTATGSTTIRIISQQDSNYWVLGLTSVGKLATALSYECGGWCATYSNTAINDGNWHYVSVSRTANSLIQYYVDGSPDGSFASASSTAYQIAADVYIGSYAGSSEFFTGQLDEVSVFNTARTAAQIQADYNARRLVDTTTGLVGLWHFDEGQGTRTYDSSGNNNHGTLTNMAATAWVNSQNDKDQSASSQQTIGVDPNWANGVARESNSVRFVSGSSTYVGVSDSTSLRVATNKLTLEAWINVDSLPVSGAGIIAKDHTIAGGWVSYMLRIFSDGTISLYIDNNSTGVTANWTTSSALTTGRWYHIAGVWNRSAGTSADGKIFIDGVNQSTTFTGASYSSSFTIAYSTLGLRLGSLLQSNYFSGMIDEVRISDNARYSANFTPSRRLTEDSNTAALWHLDEGTGTNAGDASSNANEGTLTNSPTWVTDARAVMDNNSRYISLGSSTSANTDKGMEIYAISTTQFKYRWTGDQTWSSAVNFSSYPFATPTQLGTTGVYVGFDTTNGTFGDESYFLIPSWAIQQFSSNRGVRRSFPERSYLVATDRSVDIIDADDNTLWMRTTNGVSGQLLGTQTLNVPSSVTMAHGQLMVSTNGTAGTGVYRLDFNRDTAYRYNATNRTTGNNNLAKRNATDWSWGSADTGQNLIDSIVNDVSLLVINGKCVTGDTLLRRRRRKNGKWVYDEVRIDEVEVGDEILSLNEKTGKFEWQIVEAKKNMGVKDTWQIITESGKKIRATSDHKFLSSVAHSRSGTFEVDQSNRIEDLARDTYIAITGHGHTNLTIIKSGDKREVFNKYYKNRQKLFGPTMWARVVNHLLVESEIQNAKIILDIEYSNYDKLIEQIATNGVKNISVEFRSIGKESPAHIAVWTANREARKTTGASGITQTAKDVLHPEFTGIRTSSSRNLSGDYQNLAQKSSPVWTETADLASNYWIATETGWEKVKVVYKVAHETVWDIRVSKNHNFVGNGLVAHNCMLATANNTGLTKISNIMSNDTSYDYSDVTSNAYNRVKLAENYVSGTGAVGDMYALNSTNNALERWNNVVADSASETNGTPDATVNATSTPALFASTQTVNDLDVKTGTSLVNSGNNTVFVGHNGGTTTFQEHRTTLASSSVKYYTKDYIGEEMVGDIRAKWPMYETSGAPVDEISLKNLDGTATGTTIVSGVRGKARKFNGTSSDYITVSDNSGLSSTTKSLGLWIKYDTLGTNLIAGKTNEEWLTYNFTGVNCSANKFGFAIDNATNTTWVCASGTTTPSTGQWYFVVGTYDGTNIRLYVNGTLEGGPTSHTAPADQATAFEIGGSNANATGFTAATIDEVFLTATVLSATQIQQMYISGLEAKNNKYRVKLASDTVNQLAGSINVVKGVAASDNYIFAGTNTTGADDGILSRVLLRGDVTDKTYDESTTDPLIVDNDINSVAVSKDGAYIVVGTDDQGITIIHNGSATNRLRSGGKVQGPSKRPSN